MRAILSLAAALTLLATGYWFGRRPGTASELAPEGRRYALLLYEDPAFRPDASDAQLVTEYSAWAVSLRHEGHLQLGEKLADAETILELSADSITAQPSPVRAGMGSVAGFFIIHARSDAEALAIARACPHLKYGGRIGLRAIEET